MSSKDFLYGMDENPYPNGYLNRMAIVGDTGKTSTKLWFRTGRVGDFQVLIYKIPDGEDQVFKSFSHFPFLPSKHKWEKTASFSIQERLTTDYTHVVTVDGLEPGTLYGYALYQANTARAGTILLGKKRKHSFQTLPASDTAPFSFAFYSCHMPYEVDNHFFSEPTTETCNTKMWQFFRDAVATHRERGLRFLIGGGDQAYCDGVKTIDLWKFLDKRIKRDGNKISYPSRDAMLSWFRSIYRGYWNFLPLQKIFANTPTYMMWDDHELCDGFGSYKHDPKKKDIGEYSKLLPNLEKQKYSYTQSMKVIEDYGNADTRNRLSSPPIPCPQ